MSAEHDAIAAAIEDIDPGAVVTKWVFVAEVITASGAPRRWITGPEGSMRWDQKGLLKDALDDLVIDQFIEALEDRGA